MATGEGPGEQAEPVYDKGDRRYKHVGRNPFPEFRSENDPRRVVGLCPSTLAHADHQRLLREAIPDGNGDRSIDFPKRLHVVHEGAIYRAETTDWGRSYHGYPYRGKMGRGLLEKLRATAEAKGVLPNSRLGSQTTLISMANDDRGTSAVEF
jgi:hypothetical protein